MMMMIKFNQIFLFMTLALTTTNSYAMDLSPVQPAVQNLLWLACREKDTEMAQEAINNGANLNAEDSTGRTVLDYLLDTVNYAQEHQREEQDFF